MSRFKIRNELFLICVLFIVFMITFYFNKRTENKNTKKVVKKTQNRTLFLIALLMIPIIKFLLDITKKHYNNDLNSTDFFS